MRLSIDRAFVFGKIAAHVRHKRKAYMIAECLSEAEMRIYANFYIKLYFSSYGIPESSFSDPKYADICLNTDICSGMHKAYKAMSYSDKFRESSDSTHPIEKDVRFVIKTLARMSKIVPQELSAGMLLVHLEILEGLSFN
jgi:hypothetical protein